MTKDSIKAALSSGSAELKALVLDDSDKEVDILFNALSLDEGATRLLLVSDITARNPQERIRATARAFFVLGFYTGKVFSETEQLEELMKK